MANQVRFSQLVKASGRPHAATLWVADPSKDPEFKKAIADNRIVTIHHVNVGSKKESGEIGFVKGGGAGYLIFPKSLPLAEGTRVIGLKYEMLEEPEVKNPVKIEPAKRQAKIEHANIVEFPPPKADKAETNEPEPEKSEPPKKDAKKKADTKPKSVTFKVTVEFTARARKEIQVGAKSATEAIEKALRAAKHSEPSAKWELDAADVKRCE